MSPLPFNVARRGGPAPGDKYIDLQEPLEREGYRIHSYAGILDQTAPTGRRRDTEYRVDGDTLTVLEIIGPEKIAIATSVKGRTFPFIPVEEGMVISRPFDRFIVRNLFGPTLQFSTINDQSITEAKIVSSYGPVLTRQLPKPMGVFAPQSAQGNAAAAGTDIFLNAFVTAGRYGTSDLARAAFMKYGGRLRIQNMDAANWLWLYHGRPGSFALGSVIAPSQFSAWRILPNTIFELDCEAMVSERFHDVVAGLVGGNPTLCLAGSTPAPAPAAVAYLVMVPRYFLDSSDTESGTTIGNATGLLT